MHSPALPGSPGRGERPGQQRGPQGEILHLHVFVRVVAAVGVAQEYHGRWDARTGEVAGVMTAPARNFHRVDPERPAAVGEDGPQARVHGRHRPARHGAEIDPHAATPADLRRVTADQLLHPVQRLLGVAPRIEREIHLAGNLGVRVGIRVGEQPAARQHQIASLGLDAVPARFQRADVLGHRHHRVAAQLAGRSAGVVVTPDAAALARPHVPPDARHDSDGKTLVLEHGPLLDVQFVVGRDPGRVEVAPALPQRRHVQAQVRHVLGQRPPGVGAPRGVELIRRQGAQGGAASNVVDREPAGLLRPDRHDREIPLRREPLAAERVQRDQAGDDACGAVVVSAAGDRIEVGGGDHPVSLPRLARPGHVQIAGAIGLDLQVEAARRLCDQLMGDLLALAVGRSGHADRVPGPLPKSAEEVLGERDGCLDRLDEGAGHNSPFVRFGPFRPAAAERAGPGWGSPGTPLATLALPS